MTPEEIGPGDHALAVDATLYMLRAAHEDLVAEITHAVHHTVPEYAQRLAGRAPDDEQDTVWRLVTLGLDLLEDQRRLSDPEHDAVAEIGFRLARTGLSADALVHALHVATTVGRRHLVAACVAAAAPDPVRDDLVEALSHAEYDLQHALRTGVERHTDQEREAEAGRGTLLRDLAEHRVDDIAQRLDAVDSHLTPPLGVLVLAPALPDPASPSPTRGPLIRRARACIHTLELGEGAVLGPAVIEPEPDRLPFALALFDQPVEHDLAARLANALFDHGLAAIAVAAPSLDDVHPTIRRLHATVPFLPQLIAKLGPLMTPDQIRPWRLAGALWSEEQDHLFRTYIEPLAHNLTPDSVRDHLKTVRTYLQAECNAAETARRLPHSQTAIRKRLATINDLTGQSVRDRRDDWWTTLHGNDLWHPHLSDLTVAFELGTEL